MTTDTLYQELQYVNHTREKRLHYANLVINNPSLVPKLFDILFNVDDKISPRAAWILEFMCGKDLNTIIPHLDVFTQGMGKVYLDPAVRPVAKICEYLIKAFYGKKDSEIKNALLPLHREKIIEACFDWMINDEKIAPKAYAMNSLFLLGYEYDWIHQELKIILERDYQMQSSGFKSRAKHIIKKINTQ